MLVALRSTGGLTHLALLAISSQPPTAEQVALKVPEIECRRAGLSDLKQAWVTVSEYNYDVAERSFYLDPADPTLGRFGKSFLREIAEAAAPLFQSSQLRVDRTE